MLKKYIIAASLLMAGALFGFSAVSVQAAPLSVAGQDKNVTQQKSLATLPVRYRSPDEVAYRLRRRGYYALRFAAVERYYYLVYACKRGRYYRLEMNGRGHIRDRDRVGYCDRRGVSVRAPFAGVDVDDRGVRVRAPFVDLWVPRR